MTLTPPPHTHGIVRVMRDEDDLDVEGVMMKCQTVVAEGADTSCSVCVGMAEDAMLAAGLTR